MSKCRAAVLLAPRKMEMQSFPLPAIGEDDGLLRIELVGVCGSDPGIYRGKPTRAPRPYPLIMGHEIVGRVEALGPRAAARHQVKVGDRVIVEYAFGCGVCDSCRAGRYTLCRRFYTYGNLIGCSQPPHLMGGYAQYLYIHPQANLHYIGEDISPEEGVLIAAVLGNAIRWLLNIGGATLGRPLAIVGPGPQGLAGVMAAVECGAEPVMVVGLGRDQKRLAMARRFGAHRVINSEEEDPAQVVAELTGGQMCSLVMDVSGSPAGAAAALSLAAQGATLVLPGLYGAQTPVPLLLDQVVFKELRLLGAYSHDFPAVEQAIKLARRRRFPLQEMISHRLPLERAEEAVLLMAGELPSDEPPLKIVLDPWA